jgi:tetratricopeptide (TPR) repeat protein
MRTPVRICVVATVVFAATTFLQLGSLRAQAPEEPKNLKVLPKDMSRREVVELMRSFTQSLGVRCIECHVSTKPGSERPEDMDYAKDEKKDKETARRMMKMVMSINDQIGKMEFKDAPQVGCFTCHHGVKRPEQLGAILTRAMGEKGVDGAIESYRKLREQYYGSAAYDFSPPSLNRLASNLAESKKDFDGAIKLVQLNLEFTPKDPYTHVTLGQVQMAKGDKAAAIASFEKAIELDPNNNWAKQQMERAKGAK